MTSTKNNKPLIWNDHGVAVAFESDWLKAALESAARRAGYDGWWLLDEFTSVVAQYLRQDYGGAVIDLPRLEKVVRGALRDIGYNDIATRFRTVNPFQRVSLLECLKTSRGGKGEQTFFKRLADRIEALHFAKVRQFHLCDLQLCSLRLLDDNSVSSWWSGPLMRARIVGFVRERVQAFPCQRDVQFTIR